MSKSHQSPRNGLAKLLWEADPDDSPDEIAAEKERFQCPACGWTAELRRNECMVCDYDQPLRSARAGGGGDA
jgi:hypothetical protein